ncbi:PPK2 family polyphosphate kinase [Herbiconiux liukaitaii]|uniref:PPK2 family polyphosphate kinase n=1 Tax=Herbiconiux liukaitaii TaxID=3342799 RepID=UPI0035BAEB32
MTKQAQAGGTWGERLRIEPGRGLLDLAAIPTDATPGVADKLSAAELSSATAPSLAELQEKLFASSLYGGTRSVLLVLQGMDTAGKGGVVKRVAGSMDPQGVAHHAFKKPTEEELAHPFLWRVEKRLSAAGYVGIFDRSHYEDVLVPAVHGSIPAVDLAARRDEINAFERRLVGAGTVVVKVLLHLGYDEQRSRLLRRLDRPDKHWKFSTADVDDRALWPRFQAAYAETIAATSTSWAPWHVVPADRKWYSALAVQQLLDEALRGLDLEWPVAEYDVEEQRARLLAT